MAQESYERMKFRQVDRQTLYPKLSSKLVNCLSSLSTVQIIQNVGLLKNKQDVTNLLVEVKEKQQLRGQQLPTIFLKNLSKKLQSCFEYIQIQGINLSEKLQLDFIEAVYLIFRKSPIKISFKLFMMIWEIIQKTTQFYVFHKYTSVLTSIVLYSSMREFGRANNTTIKQIQTKLNNQLNFLNSNNKEREYGLTIFKSYDILTQEERIVIKFHLFRLIQMLEKQNKIVKSQQIEKFQIQVLNLAKKENCKLIFQTINKFPNLFRKLNNKITNQFIEFSINVQNKCLIGKQKLFCKEAMNLQNIKIFLEQEDDLIKEMTIILHENKIYSKYNFQLLQVVEKNILKKQQNFKSDSIFSLKLLLMRLFENQNLEVVFVSEGKEEKLNTRHFISKIFQIFIKYLYLSGKRTKIQDIQNCFNQEFIDLFFSNFTTWSKDQNETIKQYAIQTLGDIISFSSFYLYREINKNQQIRSKIISRSIQLVLSFNKIPLNWRTIKHLRFLMQVWMTKQQTVGENAKIILNIFLNSFFSQSFVFTKGSYYVFLDKVKPNNDFCKLFSEQLLVKVQEFAKQIQRNPNFVEDQSKCLQYNKFIFKVSILILGVIKFSTAQEIAKIFQHLYLQYANLFYWIYPLRTWIIHNIPHIQINTISQLIKEVTSKIKENKFLFQTQKLAEFLQKQELENQEQQLKLNQLEKKIVLLQNILDLKQISIQFTKQVYKCIIQQIIKPFSNWCGRIYYDVTTKIQNSKQTAIKIKQNIFQRLFRSKRSIYHLIYEAFTKLQLTLRLYVCNIERTINYTQLQIICKEVGQIINQSLDVQEQIQLSHLRLVKNLTGLQTIQYESHLSIRQIFNYSSAYNNLKYQINTKMPHLMPFNVVIPIFLTITNNFPLIIARFTSWKRNFKKKTQNFQNILQGKQLETLIQDQENEYENLIKVQKANVSTIILHHVFLPALMNKKKIQLQKIGFSVYLSQIKLAFQSEKCEEYIQDHMQQILHIFKHKNSKSLENYDEQDFYYERNYQQLKIQEPTNFEKYKIDPLQFNLFKQEVIKVIKKFLTKFPTLLFRQHTSNLMVSLKSIINFIKQISNISKQSQQSQGITVDYLIIKLLQKSKEVFHDFHEKQKQRRAIKISDKIQNKEIKSINEQLQQDQQMSYRQRKQKMFKQRQKNKRKKQQSGLYVLFNVLASIDKKNEKLMKKCFQLGIQTDLLKFFQIATKKQIYDLKQICQFIQISLPTIYKTQNRQQIQTAIQYYQSILTSIENLQIKNLNFAVPLLIRLIKQIKNLKEAEFLEFAQQIIERIKKITYKCFKLPYKMSRENLNIIINSILQANSQYMKRHIQFEIRNYIDEQYKKAILLASQKSDHSAKITVQPNHIQIFMENLKQSFGKYIQKFPSLFYKVVRQIFEGWKQSNYTLVYKQGLQRLGRFSEDGLSFGEYRAPIQIQTIIIHIVKQFVSHRIIGSQMVIKRSEKIKNIQNQQQKQAITKEFYKNINPISKNMFNYLEVIQQIMKTNQLLIPFISAIPITNNKGQKTTFLDFIIDVCIQQNIDSMINLLTIFLNKNGLYLNYSSNILFSQFVAAKTMIKILTNIKNQKQKSKLNQTLYLASVCLGIKVFNNFSQLNIQSNQVLNLKCQIENLLKMDNQNHSHIKLLYQQCLYLIIRHAQITKLKNKNSLKELTSKGPFISEKLFLISQRSVRRRMIDDDSDDQDENFFRQKEYQLQQSLAIKNKKKQIMSVQIQWKSLTHILQVTQKYLKLKVRQQDYLKPLFQLKQKNLCANNINLSFLSEYFKISNIKNYKSTRSRRRGMRYSEYQDNNNIVTTISLNQNQKLHNYYQNLRYLLPVSKYRITKKESKFVQISQEESSQNQDHTLRNQLQQYEQHEQRSEQNISGERSQRIRVSTRQFILMLESIRGNSLNIVQAQNNQIKPNNNKKVIQNKNQDLSEQFLLQLKLSKSTSKKQQNIMVQTQKLSQRHTKLLQNQNYRKYYNMNYNQQTDFLINQADDKFFQNLPSEVSTQIREQATLLKNQRARLLAQKMYSQRFSQRRYAFGQSYGMRRRKKIQKQKIKYQSLLEEQQISLSQEIIQNILKCLFIKVITKKQFSRNDSQRNELNCGKGVSLLLQTKKSNIKYKVLTTLLVIIKNLQKLSIDYYFKNQDEQWKKSQKPVGLTLLQAKQKFITQILKIIKHSLDQALFNNDDLVLHMLSTKNYYKQILPLSSEETIAFQTQIKNENESLYSPFNQILALALDYDIQFASILFKKCGDVNNTLINKIFELMKNNKITSNKFYKNLKTIENNQNLKKLFLNNFSLQNPPSFELLGKILKYKFGQLPYAKDLHMKAFYEYKKSYNQYFIQIFRLYQTSQLQKKQPQLMKIKKIYSNIIQEMYKNGQNIRQSPLHKITQLPNILDFKTKKAIFRTDPIFDRINFDPFAPSVQLLIDLDNVFASAYNQIMRLQPSQIQRDIRVKFTKSTSHGSGMLKTLLQLLYEQIFNQNTSMFATVQLQGIFQPSKLATYSNPEYLNCFKFLGRVLGICVLQNQVFPAFFTSTFYKMLLNKLPNWKDLRQVNKDTFEIIRGLINCRQQDPEVQIRSLGDPIYFFYKGKDMTFKDIEYQLKQNGKNIQVCNANLDQYIELMTRSLLINFCQKEYEKIIEGFNEIMPIQKLSIFTSEDLEKLISGISKFDRKQFQECCEIHGFKKQDQQIQWFWKYVNQCSDEDLVDLVEYFYGMCKLPAGGFASIQVSIKKLNQVNTFPRASLCGKMGINLPKYTKYQIFVEKFEQAKILAQKGGGLMEF